MNRKERIIKKCCELRPELGKAGIFIGAVEHPSGNSHKVYLSKDEESPALSDGFYLDETVENVCLNGDCTAWEKLLDDEIKKAKKAGLNI